jgi:hypothetical protein
LEDKEGEKFARKMELSGLSFLGHKNWIRDTLQVGRNLSLKTGRIPWPSSIAIPKSLKLFGRILNIKENIFVDENEQSLQSARIYVPKYVHAVQLQK